MTLPDHVVVCGGAGFIGAHVCKAFVAAGSRVTAVDALVPGTGGSLEHLDGVGVRLLVRDVANATEVLRECDLVVDAMGWTAHLAGMRDPLRDLDLNLRSHLQIILALRERGGRIIYLGSRHEYGRTAAEAIDESTPLEPVDVQSVHKSAADHHYRVVASEGRLNVLSARFGNVFGEGQPLGHEAGLIGGFIRDLIAGRTIEVYGASRRRNCLYAPDLAAALVALARTDWAGYVPVNVPGDDLTIGALAEAVVRAMGSGRWAETPMPPEVAAIEIGEPRFESSRYHALAGDPSRMPLDAALARTVADARRRLS